MTQVGVKEFKDHLSKYLRSAGDGERIVITDHGRPVAMVCGVEDSPDAGMAWDMVADGVASWGGGKPLTLGSPPVVTGKSTAEIVLEGRR